MATNHQALARFQDIGKVFCLKTKDFIYLTDKYPDLVESMKYLTIGGEPDKKPGTFAYFLIVDNKIKHKELLDFQINRCLCNLD